MNLPGLFRTFDFPNPDATSPERVADHRAAAGAVLHEQSARDRSRRKHLLARPDVAAETDPAEKIGRLYRLAFGRDPTAEELDWAQAVRRRRRDAPAVWNELAQGLLLANEFVFID